MVIKYSLTLETPKLAASNDPRFEKLTPTFLTEGDLKATHRIRLRTIHEAVLRYAKSSWLILPSSGFGFAPCCLKIQFVDIFHSSACQVNEAHFSFAGEEILRTPTLEKVDSVVWIACLKLLSSWSCYFGFPYVRQLISLSVGTECRGCGFTMIVASFCYCEARVKSLLPSCSRSGQIFSHFEFSTSSVDLPLFFFPFDFLACPGTGRENVL